jgi:hypothetical protein
MPKKFASEEERRVYNRDNYAKSAGAYKDKARANANRRNSGTSFIIWN